MRSIDPCFISEWSHQAGPASSVDHGGALRGSVDRFGHLSKLWSQVLGICKGRMQGDSGSGGCWIHKWDGFVWDSGGYWRYVIGVMAFLYGAVLGCLALRTWWTWLKKVWILCCRLNIYIILYSLYEYFIGPTTVRDVAHQQCQDWNRGLEGWISGKLVRFEYIQEWVTKMVR